MSNARTLWKSKTGQELELWFPNQDKLKSVQALIFVNIQCTKRHRGDNCRTYYRSRVVF
jgi:hypothetical protein